MDTPTQLPPLPANSTERESDAPPSCAVATGSTALVITELEALRAWIKNGEGYIRDDAPDEIARAITNRIEQLKANDGQPANIRDEPTPASAKSTYEKQ